MLNDVAAAAAEDSAETSSGKLLLCFLGLLFYGSCMFCLLRAVECVKLRTAALTTANCISLQLVELKNGETYNGHMVQCDSWMNVHLREVICTSKVGHLAGTSPRPAGVQIKCLPLC